MDMDRRRQAWAAVEALGRRSGAAAIRTLFAADPGRFDRFAHRAEGLLLDLSKTSISPEVLAALLDLARACEVEARRDAMARGEAINATEGRAVLHMALRAPREARFRTSRSSPSPSGACAGAPWGAPSSGSGWASSGTPWPSPIWA